MCVLRGRPPRGVLATMHACATAAIRRDTRRQGLAGACQGPWGREKHRRSGATAAASIRVLHNPYAHLALLVGELKESHPGLMSSPAQ